MLQPESILAQFEQRLRARVSFSNYRAFGGSGAKLGNPTNLDQASLLGGAVQRRTADQLAVSLLPLVESIRKTGASSLSEIAEALNGRGIRAARGTKWHRSSVRNLIARIDAGAF